MKRSVIGVDIAKKVFQLHTVDQRTGKIECIKLRRDEVLAFFANCPTSLVAIEACGSAHCTLGTPLCATKQNRCG